LITVGLGGVANELLHDESCELPPLDERLAVRMLERLHSWPLFQGYRGRPALSVERMVETLLRVSALVTECPELEQLELDPLVVSSSGATVATARVTVRPREDADDAARSFGHLSIAPYPDWLTHSVKLKDGTTIVLRAIRPDDTELWHEMLDAASERSILFRFRSLFRQVVHRQAARYCFIDYDREMAFVAEATSEGRRRLVGVGRLVSDSTRESAEFGILVIDAWQGRGLGGVLLDACLDYARTTKYIHIYAQTSWDNERMIRLFRQRGFHIERYPDDPTTLRATRPAQAD